MRIYLASKYGTRADIAKYAEELEDLGYTCTSTWLDGNEENQTQEQSAIIDYEDVKSSDCVVSFTQPFGSANTGGGRHTELGLSLAWGKINILVGPREQIFHHMPEIIQVDTWEQCKDQLKKLDWFDQRDWRDD